MTMSFRRRIKTVKKTFASLRNMLNFVFSVLGNKNAQTMPNSIMSAPKQVNKVKPINRPADKGSPNQNYNR